MRKSTRALLTPAAVRDLRRIRRWILRESGRMRADRIVETLVSIMERLVELPAMGAPRPSFGADVRCFVNRPYLVFYRRIGDRVQILRVIDGRRDLQTAWQEDNPLQ